MAEFWWDYGVLDWFWKIHHSSFFENRVFQKKAKGVKGLAYTLEKPLKRREFDVFMPHKYKSILWGPRDFSRRVLKIPTAVLFLETTL